ncbi:LOW QUALITY PROTEIN: reverse transcriptase [Phytophthora megakarya]|uniref:Reverse transcriptase n=1 Tax=Phytophthora megakarya TaxID=4795 RepID=A0A225VZB3_9STRA|nr:LOW QUALITY PROTEIN: reverse transcriptase [Phytophthora megakarya]
MRSTEIDHCRDRTRILTLESRPKAGKADATQDEAEFPDPGRGCPSTPTTSPDADQYLSGNAEGGGIRENIPDQATDRTDTKDIKTGNLTDTKDIEPKTEKQTQMQLDQGQIKLDPGEEPDAKLPITLLRASNNKISQQKEPQRSPHTMPRARRRYTTMTVAISQPKLLKETWLSSPKSRSRRLRSIEDLQVGDSGSATPEEIEKLRQIIWKKRHLLIGKGNALPPEAKRVVRDIDVGNVKPIALRTRKVPTRFREKVAGLFKGLLAAEIIRPSTSPWTSPIVIVPKERRRRYQVYCSLDMASGFWVVLMTDRAREISAFITPFGLFE